MSKSNAPKVTHTQARALRDFIINRGPGRANAISALRIADHLGFVGSKENKERRVRALHNLCIELGYVICSGDPGYWDPADMDEVNESTRRWASQAKDMNQKVKRLERNARARFVAQRRVTPQSESVSSLTGSQLKLLS